MSEQIISADEAGTLPGLFRERVRRSPEDCAYRFYDALNEIWTDVSWNQMAREVNRWQMALAEEDLQVGDRVAIMARNSRYWVMFDQAALGLGLVVVPLYTDDRVDNVAYVLQDAGVKLLVIGGQPQWDRLQQKIREVSSLDRIVSIAALTDEAKKTNERLTSLSEWLPARPHMPPQPVLEPAALATIVYTSGTTGRPKGVMLSHRNILTNAYSGLQTVTIEPQQVFLSFLPLSHTLERTIGYYLPMMAGGTVAHARSIPDLPRDLQIVKPTGLISVPRIFDRVYARIKDNLADKSPLHRRIFELAVDTGWCRFEYLQGRAAWHPGLVLWPVLKRLVADKITSGFGGNLQIVISGGAALSPEVSRVFIALGIPILQGYGLTEASPVVSVNRIDDNRPESIGLPVPGVEVRIGDNDELEVRGENVMLGYWNNPSATAAVLDDEGWLQTGDKARINNEHIYITGRIKDIIVLSTGEKISPADMENAITSDPLFEQAIIIGEARPALTAVIVLNETQWQHMATVQDLAVEDFNGPGAMELYLERIKNCLHDFPGYAQIHRITATREEWTVDNDLLTPTMKIKRPQLQEKFQQEIENMYNDHTPVHHSREQA
jgi:long-chain acyl-CoA synthetase